MSLTKVDEDLKTFLREFKKKQKRRKPKPKPTKAKGKKKR